ncbi:MAG TPA: VPDSG-CTERM sorting domain-containing protein [Luteitalea sp.]|nr:VPDSG-CTERM sorting domain-containing protein [Luteitalea sp.]
MARFSIATAGTWTLAAGFLLLAGSATSAVAGPIGDEGSFQQTRQSGYYTGNGGEFTVYGFGSSLNVTGYTSASSNIGSMDPSFQTFCLESSEYAASPSYFKVNSAAVGGGNEAVGGKDPISVGTAWLYTQFATGTLNNYFTGDRTVKAGQLQQAIWWLEGEDGNQDLMTNQFYSAAVTFFGSAAAAQADAQAGYLGVYVLNNYTNAARTEKAQDFLYRVPDGGTTLMLLGAALVGLRGLRRKLA